jgi:tetratricopeptide (TPR) repeat protein
MNKLEQAMHDHKQGLWEQADNAYNELILEEPENADVIYLLATSKMAQTKLTEALELINNCIEINDKAPAFYQLKGSIFARMGNIKEAIESINIALKENPNLYQSHIVAGHLYYSLGKKAESEKHFKLALKIDPKKTEARVNIAKMNIDEGQVEKAINALREIELEHPEQASVKMMMGQAFLENGAYSYAENYFQKVLAMQPNNDLAGLYLGIAKLETGDLVNAEKLIITFNNQHKNTKEGIAAMGMWLFKSKRYKSAIEYLKSAIGKGLAPLSWKAAYVEALSRLGEYDSAINFYLERQKIQPNKIIEYRIGELYELKKNYQKAIKYYKGQSINDIKYISALLGLGRCYLHEKKPEEAKEYCKKVLEKNIQHAEATYLLVISLLELNNSKEALNILNNLTIGSYNETYKRVFQLLLGLIYDDQKQYDKAYNTFSKLDISETPKYRKMTEEEVKSVQGFESKIDDNRKDPVFIVGAKSTGLNEFINWIYQHKLLILDDRLISLGRDDILHSFVPMNKLISADNDMVRLERKIYHQKVKALIGREIDEKAQIIDTMFINPYQLGIVKKFFPKAKVILLTRNTADIWLNQQTFGKEPIDSKEWNEATNQIISMGLNLTQINLDDWLSNKTETIQELEKIFNIELNPYSYDKSKFWNQTLFPAGHWKNYKSYLGK